MAFITSFGKYVLNIYRYKKREEFYLIFLLYTYRILKRRYYRQDIPLKNYKCLLKFRREGDSNPWYDYSYASLAMKYFRPLSHLSTLSVPLCILYNKALLHENYFTPCRTRTYDIRFWRPAFYQLN
jgi:hypothetical protein